MAEEASMEDEEADPQQNPYMLFLLVLVFFFTGLLGFLICHVLKKKGYRCRTFPDDLDPETKDALKESQSNTEDASNEDTVERIVKCIIQNEANAEALKQMLGDNEGEVPVVPRFRVTHIGKKPSFQESHDDPPSDASSKHNISDQVHEGKKTEATSKGCSKNGPVQHGTAPNGSQKKGLIGRKFSKEHVLYDDAQNTDVANVKAEEFQASVTKENESQEESIKLCMNKQRRNSCPHQALGEGGTVAVTETEEHSDSKVTLDRKQDVEKNI